MGKPSTGGSSFGTGMGGMGNFGNLWGAMGGAMGPMGGAGGGGPSGGFGGSGPTSFDMGMTQSPFGPGPRNFGQPYSQAQITAGTTSTAFPFGVSNQVNPTDWRTTFNIQNFPSAFTAAPNPADATTNEWGLPMGQYPW